MKRGFRQFDRLFVNVVERNGFCGFLVSCGGNKR